MDWESNPDQDTTGLLNAFTELGAERKPNE